jgi:cytochrome c oxidase subunit 6a
MFPQRIVRAAPRFTAQFRAQAQRRFASTETENAFIRERRHVKEHARATTGEEIPVPWLSIG